MKLEDQFEIMRAIVVGIKWSWNGFRQTLEGSPLNSPDEGSVRRTRSKALLMAWNMFSFSVGPEIKILQFEVRTSSKKNRANPMCFEICVGHTNLDFLVFFQRNMWMMNLNVLHYLKCLYEVISRHVLTFWFHLNWLWFWGE